MNAVNLINFFEDMGAEYPVEGDRETGFANYLADEPRTGIAARYVRNGGAWDHIPAEVTGKSQFVSGTWVLPGSSETVSDLYSAWNRGWDRTHSGKSGVEVLAFGLNSVTINWTAKKITWLYSNGGMTTRYGRAVDGHLYEGGTFEQGVEALASHPDRDKTPDGTRIPSWIS